MAQLASSTTPTRHVGRHDDEGRRPHDWLFWAVVTGWELRQTQRPEFFLLERPDSIPMRVLLQRLDDGPDGHDVAAHLDLYSADADEAAKQHVRLGGSVVAKFPWWIVMADPSGVTYCLIRRSPRA